MTYFKIIQLKTPGKNVFFKSSYIVLYSIQMKNGPCTRTEITVKQPSAHHGRVHHMVT